MEWNIGLNLGKPMAFGSSMVLAIVVSGLLQWTVLEGVDIMELLVATRSLQDGHTVKVVAGNCI